MGMNVDPQLEMDFEIEPENPGGGKIFKQIIDQPCENTLCHEL